MLTGTPVTNHHGSLYSPLKMVGGWPGSYGDFMERYCVRDFMFPSQVKSHINVAELHNLVLRHAAVVKREDVFGPDTYQTIVRHVELPVAAMSMYRKLAREWVLDAPAIVADHTLARLVRLQQLTSGSCPMGRQMRRLLSTRPRSRRPRAT